MFCRWLALVLILLQLQPALALVPGQVSSVSLEIEHTLVHAADQGHRHHDTLAFQPDEDGAAAAHAHHDAGHHAALPLSPLDQSVTAGDAAAHVIFLGGRLPDPHLEGPLRPPRSSL